MNLFVFTFQMPDYHSDNPRLNNEMHPLHNTRRLNKAIAATGASL